MVRSCLVSFFVLVFVAGCGARTSQLAHFPPSVEIFITQGNFVYSRLDYQRAWEGYHKVEVLGVRPAAEGGKKESPRFKAVIGSLLALKKK